MCARITRIVRIAGSAAVLKVESDCGDFLAVHLDLAVVAINDFLWFFGHAEIIQYGRGIGDFLGYPAQKTVEIGSIAMGRQRAVNRYF